jgi:hypothetical protein
MDSLKILLFFFRQGAPLTDFRVPAFVSLPPRP